MQCDWNLAQNGPVNIPEFGTVKDSVECKALYAMDGMQHGGARHKIPCRDLHRRME